GAAASPATRSPCTGTRPAPAASPPSGPRTTSSASASSAGATTRSAARPPRDLQQDAGLELPVANLIIRGKVISDDLVEVGGRGGDLTFLTPDAHKYLDQLPLHNPADLADLYALSFEDILDYLEAVGKRLDIETNVHLQRARALSYLTAPTTPPIVDAAFADLGSKFSRDFVRE